MLRAFSITDIGKRRKLNQDYVFVSIAPIGNLPNVFIVADGMGGHNAGDYASKYTVEMIEEQIRESERTVAADILKDGKPDDTSSARRMKYTQRSSKRPAATVLSASRI